MQFPITIGLRRSFFARAVCCGVAVVTALALGFATWPYPIRGMAFAILVGTVVIAYWRLAAVPALSIRLERAGQLILIPADVGPPEIACSLLGAYVHPWLTVIRCQDADGNVRSLVFYPDSATKEDLRRLRVFLRWRVSLRSDDA